MSNTEYTTVAEVAEKFNISTTLVYRMINQGQVPHLVLGSNTVRIPKAWVDSVQPSYDGSISTDPFVWDETAEMGKRVAEVDSNDNAM